MMVHKINQDQLIRLMTGSYWSMGKKDNDENRNSPPELIYGPDVSAPWCK